MLDAEEFLSRIVPDEGFLAFAFKSKKGGMLHRFFRRQQDMSDALSWMRYWGHRTDVWFGTAAYKDAEFKGHDKAHQIEYWGKRTQENVISVKCFWYDADISRPGDGKEPGQVWKDQIELTVWLKQLRKFLPYPNLWIRSGYGVHLYWVLDKALPRDQWIPYAKAFRSLLVKAGARGDVGVSTDCARILRPVESLNYKVLATPMQCFDDTPTKLGLPDTYDAKFLALLNSPAVSTGTNVTPRTSPVSSPLLGAAKAGLSHGPPRDIRLIADRCAQVEKSLVENGEHDGRQLWFHMLNLAFICGDQQATHDLGSKHPGYTAGDTDKEWDQRVHEHQTKGFGPPTCISLDATRPGICPNCPHWTRIASPIALGVNDVTTSGLPAGYRYNNDGIELAIKDNEWLKILDGDISTPRIQRTGDSYRILFDYTFANRTSHVVVNEKDISGTIDKCRSLFAQQGIALKRSRLVQFGDFIVAWIEELRKHTRGIPEAPPQFGWVYKENKPVGLSVAGTYYDDKGASTDTLPGDPTIHNNYQPSGTLDEWKKAVSLVIGPDIEHQVLLATAFAAPLMELLGESGGVVSVWSMETGVRKTSSLKAAASVWCNPLTMSSRRDTANSVQETLGQTKMMPVYWDEIHLTKMDSASMVDMFFAITQGRGRGRLNQRMEQRDVGQWCTLMVVASNHSMMDVVEQDRPHTDAGQVRVFEYEIKRPRIRPNQGIVAQASHMVHALTQNYGHAGREYAQYLAANIEGVRKLLLYTKDKLLQDTGGDVAERFYLNTIIGVVVGAIIASTLDLFQFDVRGVYRFLKSKLIDLRGDRQNEAPVGSVAWVVRMLEQFLTDHTGDLLVTQSYTARGRKGVSASPPGILHQPSVKCEHAFIHIGVDDALMRIDSKALAMWCQKTNIAPKTLADLMLKEWPVIQKRRNKLAATTAWASGGVIQYWEVPLSIPEFGHHLTDWGTPNTGTNVVVPLKIS